MLPCKFVLRFPKNKTNVKFQYAEIALSYIIPTKKSGITDYLAAVICYCKKQYQAALKHLEQAEKLHGLDHGTGSLKGHCLLGAGFCRQALVAYLRVLQSYNRPNDVHMVYVKAAVIYEGLKDLQEARKLMLLACKYSPTPYTWLTAGLLYYKVCTTQTYLLPFVKIFISETLIFFSL